MLAAAHIMIILDIAPSACLIDLCLKATQFFGLRSRVTNFMADMNI